MPKMTSWPPVSLKKVHSQREFYEVVIMLAVTYLLRAATHLMDVFYLHVSDEEK